MGIEPPGTDSPCSSGVLVKGGFTMPEIGTVVKGRDIGSKAAMGSANFIWHPCVTCGKQQWVQCIKGTPTHDRCVPCDEGNRKEAENGNWKGGRIKWGKTGYMAVRLQPDDFFRRMANRNGYVL